MNQVEPNSSSRPSGMEQNTKRKKDEHQKTLLDPVCFGEKELVQKARSLGSSEYFCIKKFGFVCPGFPSRIGRDHRPLRHHPLVTELHYHHLHHVFMAVYRTMSCHPFSTRRRGTFSTGRELSNVGKHRPGEVQRSVEIIKVGARIVGNKVLCGF